MVLLSTTTATEKIQVTRITPTECTALSVFPLVEVVHASRDLVDLRRCPRPPEGLLVSLITTSIFLLLLQPQIQAIRKVMAGRMLHMAAANVAVVYFMPKK